MMRPKTTTKSDIDMGFCYAIDKTTPFPKPIDDCEDQRLPKAVSGFCMVVWPRRGRNRRTA